MYCFYRFYHHDSWGIYVFINSKPIVLHGNTSSQSCSFLVYETQHKRKSWFYGNNSDCKAYRSSSERAHMNERDFVKKSLLEIKSSVRCVTDNEQQPTEKQHGTSAFNLDSIINYKFNLILSTRSIIIMIICNAILFSTHQYMVSLMKCKNSLFNATVLQRSRANYILPSGCCMPAICYTMCFLRGFVILVHRFILIYYEFNICYHHLIQQSMSSLIKRYIGIFVVIVGFGIFLLWVGTLLPVTTCVFL